jgi:hypothetical protein
MLKREMVSTASLGVLRARFSISVLCASLLCLAAVCAAGPEEASEEVNVTVQAAGVGCTILRPVGWTRLGVGCIEGPNTPIFVGDGQTYRAIAVRPAPIFGSGSTTLLCDGGSLKTIAKSCRKTAGSEP